MLDLKRFTQEKECFTPVVDGWSQVGSRKFTANVKDGWYLARIGNTTSILRPATLLEVEEAITGRKKYKGYPLGDEVIPINFQNFYEKGYGESLPVNFIRSEGFDIINFIHWEDDRLYFAGPDFTTDRSVMDNLRECFESDRPLTGQRGITPELRYYFILQTLYKQTFKALEPLSNLNLTSEEKKKRLQQFRNKTKEILQSTVEKAGGKFVSYEKYGDKQFIVTWESGGQVVKSRVSDQFRVYELGFCASGADQKFTLGSAVALAQKFQRRQPLNIMRE